jgi:hypothetical protein
MELPNRDQAHVPREKLTGYLLSETHPVGKAKAKFFRNLGFDETQVDRLEQELLLIARSQEVDEVEPTPHEVKHGVNGPVHAPGGTAATIRTVWIIETADPRPRFVTAYPI